MNHYASPAFWERYNQLPKEIQKSADRNFELLKQNINHPSLHLKKVKNYFSVRIGIHYRALAIEVDDGLLWFWIGSHAEYDNLL